MRLSKLIVSFVAAFAVVLAGSAVFAQDGGGGDKRNAVIPGEKTITFGLPSGTNPYAAGTAGMGYVVTENIVVGLNLGLSLDAQTAKEVETSDGGSTLDGKSKVDDEWNATLGTDQKSRTSFDLLVAPNMKYYMNTDGTALPYVFGQLNFQKFFDGDQTTTPSLKNDIEQEGSDAVDQRNYNPQEQIGLSIIGGFGVDWFPVPRFSVGGHVGLGIDVIRPNNEPFMSTNPETGDAALVQTTEGLAFGTFTSSLNATFWF